MAAGVPDRPSAGEGLAIISGGDIQDSWSILTII
jgi:hypothetical protein